jgi:hypothetical protein
MNVIGMAIHEMERPEWVMILKILLNKWNQMHEVSNVFVTDGSCMPIYCLSKLFFYGFDCTRQIMQ